MLSILIPIYNFNVEKLVADLVNQCLREGIAFEILCFDDHSRKKYRSENNSVAAKFGVSYIELSENYGRSKIRNTLAKNARFDYLLFIDCDSKVIRRDYISKYIQALNLKAVITGGRVYKKKPPRNLKKRLHWKYGSKRESLNPERRNKKGSSGFHSNNFIIPKSIFEMIEFNQEIEGYGYEDVLFASELEKNNIKLVNIDNPIEHLGVEQTQIFLKKSDRAIHNLVQLNEKSLVGQVRLIKVYKKFETFNAIPWLLKVYKLFENKVIAKLYGKNPNLKLFDLYRLALFCKIKQGENFR